ncbi:uncharacterized protein LTR77_010717 [Saxophila tyrrhenica]|uniref:Uncharacterized protein n=1 Tax=Saxophila tyrrhenica TaxID=1690608 RepID=A0AAV9NYA4_9PEZI|nr:hypothetical protein LTR77_010717 [Saxophila tyrrhenica]
MAIERVLIVGATGNIGVSAAIASLRTGREVLAVVRNAASAEKFFTNVGTKEGITTVEADVTARDGMQKVVDRVKAGELPGFQHVYACVGLWLVTPVHEVSDEQLRRHMRIGFESNFFAYRATLLYLLAQPSPTTFTACTGSADTSGYAGLTGPTQGALVAMLNAAIFENQHRPNSQLRINEARLNIRVEVDAEAEKHGVMKASEYAKVYEGILEREEIEGSRVVVEGPGDVHELRAEKKLKG